MWQELYDAAVAVQNDRTISPFIDAGGVAAAVLTKKGNIFVGVCIDTASALGMCAERNAIANMITNGESQIDKIVAVMPDGRVGPPCGACRAAPFCPWAGSPPAARCAPGIRRERSHGILPYAPPVIP